MRRSLSRKIGRSVEEMLDEVGDDLRQAAGEVGEQAQQTLSRAVATLKQASERMAVDVRRQGRTLESQGRRTLRDHPWAIAALIATAAAVAGVLAARRRSD